MIQAGGYRYCVGDLRTGKITRTVDLTGGSWSVPLGEPGSIGGSFPLRSKEWKTARSDAAAAKSFLAVAYVNPAGDETFIEAGPIWKSQFADSSGVFSITAGGLGTYFDHRKVIPVLAAAQTAQDVEVVYKGKQLGLIAKQLVELSQSHTGGQLPIVLPTDAELGGAGTDVEETYPGYELAWVGDKLRQLSEKGGPEIQFVPRRRTDDPRYIEWVMRIGVAPTMLLTQLGDPWRWRTGVPKSSVREIDVSSDGTKMAFRQWAAGQGQAEGRPIVKADAFELVDAGFPLLEGEVTSIDSEAGDDNVQPYADTAVGYSQRPIESWTVTVSRDSLPTVGQYRPGDWVEFDIKDHIFLPDNKYQMRILSMSGGESDTVTLALSERLGDL